MAGVTCRNNYDEDDEAFLLWEAQHLKRMSLSAGDHLRTPQPAQYLNTAAPVMAESFHEDPSQRLASLGIGIASLFSETILSHPSIVIRRQCQVHKKAFRYHLTPFTVFSVVINLQRRQGMSTLWKGLGSVFILRGITLGTEDLLSKVTTLPKEISIHSSWNNVMKHVCLKVVSFIVMTPFYSSSLIETVQSDIASEKPGVFDCIKEGICRLFRRNMTTTSRLLPMWQLIGPTVLCHLLHYILSSTLQFVTLRFLQMKELAKQNQNEFPVKLSTADNCVLELTAAFTGHFAADILLYPLETVLHRLHLQGTRTIIDNLDTGLEVIPIMTNYEGAIDCFNSIVNEEGSSALYKGFGALLIQYAIRIAILRLTKYVLLELRHP